jgi:hypothetical protein
MCRQDSACCAPMPDVIRDEKRIMDQKITLAMEKRDLRGNTRTTTLRRTKLSNITRTCTMLKLFACALFLSGNLRAQTITVDGNPADWPAVLSSSSISFKANIVDPVNSHTDNVWTRGSQNTDPINRWHWTLGNTNDKTDLGNTGVALIDHNLYFFADLYADNGDASVGFWLLKNGVAATSGGNFTGAHADGDILVSVAFTHGHRTATPTIYKWLGGALTRLTVGPTVAGAATNSVTVTAPWPYTPKHGTAGTYLANSFFEGFVNLDSFGTAFSACYTSFLFETWESQSPRAALADLVMGTLPASPSVSITNDTVCSGSTATFSASVTGGGSVSYSWNGGAYGSASTYTTGAATTSGIVTVSVRSSNGCTSASDTARLVVRPVPTINRLCNVSYCGGTSVSGFSFTSPTAGTTFTWTSTANVGFGTSGTGSIGAFTAIGGTASVTATVTVTPSNGGCTGNPVRFTICVNPAPVMTALDTGLCAGATVALTGSPAGGTWSGYGVSGSSFNAAGISPGVYTVSYWMYGAGGCVGSTTAHVTVRNCACGKFSAMAIPTAANDYGIYPNPSNGSFAVNVPALKADAEATVTDLYGRVVDKRTIGRSDNGQQLNYEMGGTSPGIYYIRIDNSDTHYTDKIILR